MFLQSFEIKVPSLLSKRQKYTNGLMCMEIIFFARPDLCTGRADHLPTASPPWPLLSLIRGGKGCIFACPAEKPHALMFFMEMVNSTHGTSEAGVSHCFYINELLQGTLSVATAAQLVHRLPYDALITHA